MDEIEQLEAELAAAEAKTKAAKDEEARRIKAADLRAKIQAEQVAARDLPKIAELEGTRGIDFDVVSCRLGLVAVKRPSGVVWKRFTTSKKEARDAAEDLVRACLAYPTASEFTAIIDDQPAALESMALTVGRLAGADLERIQGKS